MSRSIQMSAPDIDDSDVQAVTEVLRSGRLALGERAPAFEYRLASYVGASQAVAVGSGTAALHLIVKALGLGPGDEVLLPALTFAASVNALLYEGATPVFVDVEPDTYNLDPAELERKVTSRTRAVLVVDLFGHPAEWDEIRGFARPRDLALIDDACEALGAEYRGERVGRLGTAAAFGFYPNKQITTGEGGMVVTDDARLAELARSLRNQGRDSMTATPEHVRLGYNYRMDEMSAALGLSQLGRIESILARRDRVAALYTARLADVPWIAPPVVKPHVRISWFGYVVTLPEDVPRDALIGAMQAQGVPARGYFPPVHLEPYLRRRFGFERGALPIAESIGRRTLALPFHNRLDADDVDRVVRVLCRAREAVYATR